MASIVGTKGVDISYAQGNINMSKVKEAGYGWVMIRVGQGTRIIDNQFAANVEKSIKVCKKLTCHYNPSYRIILHAGQSVR